MDFLDITLSLLALTVLEVILGIDNLVFLAILSQKLPKTKQKRARQIGLTFAWMTRLLLLASAVWLVKLKTPWLYIYDMSFSGRDLFLIIGGIFLLWKATQEIHIEIDPEELEEQKLPRYSSMTVVIAQIALLDIVFSLDSVLTAIGLTTHFWLMATAITISIIAMIFASETLSHFIERNPTIKMLALSFLMLIGTVLIADGFKFHVPRAYIYFAMGFSLFVELLNVIRRRNRRLRTQR